MCIHAHARARVCVCVCVFKEEPKLSQGLLFSSHLLGQPVLTPQGFIFLCLQKQTNKQTNKQKTLAVTRSCNTNPSVT